MAEKSGVSLGDAAFLRDLWIGLGAARLLDVAEPVFRARAFGNGGLRPSRDQFTIDELIAPFHPVPDGFLFSQPFRLGCHGTVIDRRSGTSTDAYAGNPRAALVGFGPYDDLKLAIRNSACRHRFLLCSVRDRHSARLLPARAHHAVIPSPPTAGYSAWFRRGEA
ncbi:hypothetical protein Bxe_A3843 [Paraburkholderia xenovorans LB400]|uniref:Uncharacterized protein n=1 Tax=Paraburkholderia xenovorans (strain LB400) TaxID=266265 RepID=Q144T4_PARXL|nr:hypothetical protein Bxe_A3843 [Paraburkholderia xenovorans LB400]